MTLNTITLLDKPMILGPSALQPGMVLARASQDGTLGRRRLYVGNASLVTPKTQGATAETLDMYTTPHKGRPSVVVVGTATPLVRKSETVQDAKPKGPKPGEKARKANVNVNETVKVSDTAPEPLPFETHGNTVADTEALPKRITKAAAADAVDALADAVEAQARAMRAVAAALR